MTISNKLMVSVITCNSEKYIKDFLLSVLDNDVSPKKILIFDNNSHDKTLNISSKICNSLNVIRCKKNLGYAKAINEIFRNTQEKYILICNADIEFKKNSIKKLLTEIETDKKIGCLGPQQYFPNNKWQRSGGDFPSFKEVFKRFFLIDFIKKKIFEKFSSYVLKKKLFLDYLDGAAILINRDAFELVGGFDPDYFFYSEEVDFFFRLKEKKIIYYNYTSSKIMHHRGGHSVSKNFNNDLKFIKYKLVSRLYFLKKYKNKTYIFLLLLFESFYFFFYAIIYKCLNIFNKKYYYNYLYYKFAAKMLFDEIKK
jgi:GT2 family glycosyltransferase